MSGFQAHTLLQKFLSNLDCQEFADFRNSANNSQSPMVVSTIQDLKAIIMSQAKMQVPIEFEQLRNKSMVFRINLKNEHIRNPAKPISVLSESESGDEAISPIVQANLKLKGVANDQDEVDTGAIKRCLLDQFSTSHQRRGRAAVLHQRDGGQERGRAIAGHQGREQDCGHLLEAPFCQIYALVFPRVVRAYDDDDAETGVFYSKHSLGIKVERLLESAITDQGEQRNTLGSVLERETRADVMRFHLA
nr:hypothetical protein Iba_chr08aCG10860 [Ipomoea batatas]